MYLAFLQIFLCYSRSLTCTTCTKYPRAGIKRYERFGERKRKLICSSRPHHKISYLERTRTIVRFIKIKKRSCKTKCFTLLNVYICDVLAVVASLESTRFLKENDEVSKAACKCTGFNISSCGMLNMLRSFEHPAQQHLNKHSTCWQFVQWTFPVHLHAA